MSNTTTTSNNTSCNVNVNPNHIGFSHNYTKLHGQTSGILLKALPYVIDRRWFSEETYQYDTDGVFQLEEGRCLQLVFLGNKEIPFTTYRTDTPEHRNRFFDHEGQVFVFNFKSNAN